MNSTVHQQSILPMIFNPFMPAAQNYSQQLQYQSLLYSLMTDKAFTGQLEMPIRSSFPSSTASTPPAIDMSSSPAHLTISTVPSSIEPTPSQSPSQRLSSSPEDGVRVKRGRPQQDIEDQDDPSSQKRRHRRMYARQYRAQMRQRVDEVKLLKEELDQLKRKLAENEAELSRTRSELSQKNLLISGLLQRPAPY